MEPADPASPRFGADEPRVVATPFGRLSEEHPLRRAIGNVPYPAGTERVLASVRADPGVAGEQADWLETTLPAGARFESEDEVVSALGAWGPPAPSTPPAL